MATLLEFEGCRPDIDPEAWLAPTATVIGDVRIAPGASVWFGVVVRADFGQIRIGRGSCLQDNAVLHCATELPTIVGQDVTIGHMATLEGCVVEDGALVGMGAVVLQRARVGAGAMVAAGSVVTEGTEIPPGTLAAGAPAAVKKELGGSSAGWVQTAAREYQELVGRYGSGARVLEP